MKKSILILFLALLAFNCTENKQNNEQIEELRQLRAELDSLNKLKRENSNTMKGQIATFLTFQKENAEQAMNFYIGLFDNSKIVDLKRWEKEGPGKEISI
ncbi:VOC family protein [Aquimarina hainanensis]|uniref:VOC family protein n=1 Tax=Aquimarina hainanensis TaxID=1578017 RepID=A0ABW5N4Y9_9FLAO